MILGNKVPIDDNEIVDYLIDGIPDDNLRDQARMQKFVTPQSLFEAFDKISLQNKKILTTDKCRDCRSKQNVCDYEKFVDKSNKEVKLKRRCYNCGETSHLSFDCKK